MLPLRTQLYRLDDLARLLVGYIAGDGAAGRGSRPDCERPCAPGSTSARFYRSAPTWASGSGRTV